MILSLIVAYAEDETGKRVIGLDNGIPWHFPHDLARFKEHTNGCPIIMGRKTYESIGRTLPGRLNIIVSKQPYYSVRGAVAFADLEKAITHAAKKNPEIFIIGGQKLYEATIDRATRLYITSFKIEDVRGDTFFPDFNEQDFKVIHKEQAGVSGDLFRIMERRVVLDKSETPNSNRTVDTSIISTYNLASNRVGT